MYLGTVRMTKRYKLLIRDGKLLLRDGKLLARAYDPTILLQTAILELGERTDDGQIVTAVRLPWYRIAEEIKRDRSFLSHFPKHHREFEEFLAGIYAEAGFEVVLT